MPYHWVKITSSPRPARRDKAKKDAADNGGRLCEGQLFYDAAGQGYALVEVPSDANGQKKVLDAMDVTSQHGLLVDADGN
jgi:hypothetical protein